jgi:2-polyprenyl-3-methyl-5-hydroxy-6-metoxy-1,4-benzoquinol methylase
MSTTSRQSTIRRLVKRVVAPVFSPVDGRVADINRRVENARSSNEASLDAYARSASESSSYIGVELRRLHDLVAGFGERSFSEHYQERLARARGLALGELDESLAQVINYATGDSGFYAQAGLWFTPVVEVALSAGAAAPLQVNESIVEMPFAMAALGRLTDGARILEIGGAHSTFALSAASLGYEVTAIDPRPLGYAHPNLQSHLSSFQEWDPPSDPFAAAFLICGAPGRRLHRRPEREADVDLVGHLRRLLTPDGLMVLTVPYGTPEATGPEWGHDESSLNQLLVGWEVLERRVVVQRDRLVWEANEQGEAGARAVAMLIASPERPDGPRASLR